jgi:serine/threonine protein kinase
MTSTRSDRKTAEDEDSEIPTWANVDFGEIELGERIGGGGVGIVYHGWWKGTPVALKTLFDARINSDLKQEYMDELLVMSRVSHSNVVKFLGACMTPPNLCFIMELCETSLFNLLHVDRVRFTPIDCFQASVRVSIHFFFFFFVFSFVTLIVYRLILLLH